MESTFGREERAANKSTNYSSNVVVCQQCLGPLNCKYDCCLCMQCKKNYPIKKDLLFMGVPEAQKDYFQKVIKEEMIGQTDLNIMDAHYQFAYPSYKLGHLAARIIKKEISPNASLILDIGSGGAPIPKIISVNGCDVYRCDIEPNSLYAGFYWGIPKDNPFRNIVCEATQLPYKSESIDVVFSKEFAHHTQNAEKLFSEINRVLKPNGIFVLVEPSKSIHTSLFDRRKEHFGHHLRWGADYIKIAKRCHFLMLRHYLYFYKDSVRLKFLNIVKGCFYKDLESISRPNWIKSIFCLLYQAILGATGVMCFKKLKKHKFYQRDPICIIDPEQMILTDEYFKDPRLNILRDIFQDVSKDMREDFSEITN